MRADGDFLAKRGAMKPLVTERMQGFRADMLKLVQPHDDQRLRSTPHKSCHL